ncbi:MAG: rRNA pseudouridine synthase [Candidatus Marinimicrobia bacterium]|nr:rRNA pseudouridine synthase [Candidatus Neomarinimicrobiota bacterium]
MRLNKYLARTGLGSRRKCDEFIKDEKINVNGNIVTDFSLDVSDDDVIFCDGKILQTKDETFVYMMNKPKGHICTNEDPQGRPTIFDLMNEYHRLYSVGRLDRDTTGLILLTNDGDLSFRLTHPKFRIVRKYWVKTGEDIPNSILKKVQDGVKLENGELARCQIRRVDKKGQKVFWDVELREGKNQEVKRIFISLGSRVMDLHRYHFAGLELGSLKLGSYRKLKSAEIKFLYQQIPS